MTKKMDSALRRAQNIFMECVKNLLLFYILLCSLPCTCANYNSYVVNPEFGERPDDLNITTFAGQTSRLPCTVKHLQGKVVSWIRGRDLQVLSTARVTFSTDLRISVLPGTKGRKHRATRDTRSTSMHWNGSKPRIWRKGRRRKKLQVDQSIYNETFKVSSSVTQVFDMNQTKSIPRLNKGRNHISAHPIDKRYVKDLDTFHDYGFWERHSDPVSDYDIDPSTRKRYQRKFLKAYRLQDHKAQQDFSQHNSQHRKQRRQYSDYGRLLTSVEDDFHFKPRNIVTPYTRVPQAGRSQHIRAFYPQNFGDSPVPHLPQHNSQHNTPIAIYPQTYYTQDGSSRKDQASSPNYVPGVWEPEDYTLQIKFTEPGDAGLYICQINTDPKMSQNIIVKVINMKAEIVGSSELYVKAGTPVTLTCRVNHGSTMPGFIFWYRDNSLVDYDHSGGRVQVHTGSDGTSQLHLTKASTTDSANYTCWPSGGAKASVSLNVIVDERQAAMQQGNGAISCSSNPTWALLLPTCCCLVLLFGSHVPYNLLIWALLLPTCSFLVLVLGTHVPYYLLLSCCGLLVASVSKTREILQKPKEQQWFHRQFHKALAYNKHIITYISVFIAALLIYVVFINFVPFTTYTKHSPFILLSILFMILFSAPLIFPKWATVVPDVMNTSPNTGCVMWSMSSLVLYCGCLHGFM